MTFIRNLIILNPNLKTEDLIDISLSELIEISQKYELDIDKIINSKDVDRITKPSKPITIDEDPKDDDLDDLDDIDDIDDKYEDDDDDENDEDDDDDYDDDQDDNDD